MEPLKNGQEASPLEPASNRRGIYFKQVLMASAACLSYACVGSSQVWPSPALYHLSLSNETFFSTTFVLSNAEKDMTGSLLFLGILFGSLVAGHGIHRFGRRMTIQLTTLPFVVGWLIVGFAPSAPPLLLGRFMLGMAGGVVNVACTVYVLELADKKIRGPILMLPSLFISFGGQYTLWLGTVLSWFHLSFACTVPPLLLSVALFFLSESPSHLVIHGRHQEAAVVLRRLRGPYANVGAEVEELEEINSKCMGGSYRLLLQRRVFRKVLIVLSLFLLSHLSGTYVLIVQTGRILEAAGASLAPDTASGVVLGMRLAGSLVGCALMDILGRRRCLMISSFINALCLTLLGAFVYFTADDPVSTLGWMPLVCVGVALFGIEIGIQPIPFMLAAEYFPTVLRPYSSSVGSIAFTLSGFVMLQFYSPLQQALTQAGLYWFFGGFNFLTIAVTFFCVTETMKMAVG